MLCFFVGQILLDTAYTSVDFIIIIFIFPFFFSHNFLKERGVEYDHGIKLKENPLFRIINRNSRIKGWDALYDIGNQT